MTYAPEKVHEFCEADLRFCANVLHRRRARPHLYGKRARRTSAQSDERRCRLKEIT